MSNKNDVMPGTTCFKEHREHGVDCQKKECNYWIENKDCQNCTMILSSDGPKTLQQIGELFGVTRMRICQIEKSVLSKLKTKSKIEF